MRHSLLLGFLMVLGVAGGEPLPVVIVQHPRDAVASHTGPRFVVADAEARHGTAQAGLLGKSKVGANISSFYGYARPGAVYEFTWRVKVDDNSSDALVFRAFAYDESRRHLYKPGSVEVKGTDFAAPGVYQEFSFLAEKGEAGFFGVQSTWHGETNVYLDSVTFRSVNFFSEKEMLDREGALELPAAWRLPVRNPLRLHLAKGLWWEFFRLSEAMAWRRGGRLQSSYVEHGQWGSSLRGLEPTAEAFMGYNVIVLANVDAEALGPRRRLLLRHYVENGGVLLVLGGLHALTAGRYAGSALDDLLPCTFAGDDRQHAAEGLVIAPTEAGRTRLPELAWELRPRTFYYHRVEAKPDATVLLTAGDTPLLLTHPVGRGQVAFWAGTVEGDPADGQLAFWDWGGMPACISGLLDRLTAHQEEPDAVFDPKTDGAAIDRLTTLALEKDADEQAATIIEQLAARCHNPEFARELAEGLNVSDVSLSRAAVDNLATRLEPHVDASWAELLKQYTASATPGKVALGLRLLGAAGVEGAGTVLAQRLTLSGGAEVFGAESIGAAERIVLGAIQGLGNLGDTQYLGAVTAIAETLRRQLPADGDTSVIGDLKAEAWQQAVVTRVKLGDHDTGGILLDILLENTLAIEQYQNYLDTVLQNKDDIALIQGKKRAQVRLPVLRQRQRSLLHAVSSMPASVWPVLAATFAERDDTVLLPFAYAIFGARLDPATDTAALRGVLPLIHDNRHAEYRLLGCRILRAAGSVEADELLVAAFAELAASEAEADQLFAVRYSTLLAEARRVGIAKQVAQSPHPEVQRLAKSMGWGTK